MTSFPVDDATLGALEHALGATFVAETEDGPVLGGADMSVESLLDFLSGPTTVTPALNVYDQLLPDVYELAGERFSRDCVIRALLAEVRRLRADAG